jgi:hypothetical protein
MQGLQRNALSQLSQEEIEELVIHKKIKIWVVHIHDLESVVWNDAGEVESKDFKGTMKSL